MNVDFKNYGGMIGLQHEWFEIQETNPQGYAKSFIDTSIEGTLDTVVITSMHDQVIDRGSVHDRFETLRISFQNFLKDLERPTQDYFPKDNYFLTNPDSESSFVVDRTSINLGNNTLHIINGQVVQTRYNGGNDELDLVIVGANDFTPHQPAGVVAREAQDRGLIVLADSRCVLSDEGLRWLYGVRDLGLVDGVIGHYGMHTIPEFLARGPLREASRGKDRRAKNIAENLGLPWVSGSGAKYPNQTGLAYTSLDLESSFSDGSDLVTQLKTSLKEGKIQGHNEGYWSIKDLVKFKLLHWPKRDQVTE